MDRKLMMDILKGLEKSYPDNVKAGELSQSIKRKLDGEFYKAAIYLKSEGRVNVFFPEGCNKKSIESEYLMNITKDGIGYIDIIKSQDITEKTNFAMKWATIVIALSAFKDFMNFIQTPTPLIFIPVMVTLSVLIIIAFYNMLKP